MENISIVIVEDEPLIAKTIEVYLVDAGYNVVAVNDNAIDGLNSIERHKPDIALLDIELRGEETGIWLAEQINKSLNIPYIFMTSYKDKETIQKAVKTIPYGYMLKPVDEDALSANINVALERFHQENQKEEEPQFVINDAVFLKDEHYFIKLKFDSILYIQASGNYIDIFEENRKHVLKTTLKSFMQSVPDSLFFQTHRSYVVNLAKVDKIGSRNLFIATQEIPLVKEQREELLKRLPYAK